MSNFKGNKEYPKVPVRYKNKPLMPTTWRKALRLMKEKKAILVKDKVLGLYLKLKYKPKTTYTQDTYLGIDPGSMFDGYSILYKSKLNKFHNANFQFNHQLALNNLDKKLFPDVKKSGPKLKGLVDGRRMNRKLRRNRLRHRLCRYEARTKNKISNTSNYYFQNRRNMIDRVLRLYPISHIVIENVKFSNKSKGNSSSNIEIGKNRLFRYITDTLKLNLIKVSGKVTKNTREAIFEPLNLHKTKNKGYRGFEAHCIDSFTLACIGYMEVTGDIRSIANIPFTNKPSISMKLIERVPYIERRVLYQFKANRKDAIRDKDLPYYFRYGKGGIKIPFTHKSKLRKNRIRLPEVIKSNHGKIWNYIYTDPEPTFKSRLKPYGGSIVTSKKSNYYNGFNLGKSKYWNGKFYKYYDISIV